MAQLAAEPVAFEFVWTETSGQHVQQGPAQSDMIHNTALNIAVL